MIINQLSQFVLGSPVTRMAMADELGIYSGAIPALEGACLARLYARSKSLCVLRLFLPLYSRRELAQSFSPIPPKAQAEMAELQKDAFRAHMAFLADDLLEGRGTGARGHEIVARYIAAHFEAIGLKPASQEGAYLQRVPLRQFTVEPEKCSVSITENGSTMQLKWGTIFSCGATKSIRIPRSKPRWFSSATA
jgi:hypothetical protein